MKNNHTARKLNVPADMSTYIRNGGRVPPKDDEQALLVSFHNELDRALFVRWSLKHVVLSEQPDTFNEILAPAPHSNAYVKDADEIAPLHLDTGFLDNRCPGIVMPARAIDHLVSSLPEFNGEVQFGEAEPEPFQLLIVTDHGSRAHLLRHMCARWNVDVDGAPIPHIALNADVMRQMSASLREIVVA